MSSNNQLNKSDGIPKNDIRWIQRLSNFNKALSQLAEAVGLMRARTLSNLEKQGVIQAFEYTHELGWKTIKDFLEFRGSGEIYGSRDATREAFRLGLIENGDIWMQMIKSRNLTSHTYDEATADDIVKSIYDSYFDAFMLLREKMRILEAEERDRL